MMGGFGAALAAWWFAVKTKVVEYDEGGPTTEDDPTKPDVPDPVPGAGKPPKGAAIPIAIGPSRGESVAEVARPTSFSSASNAAPVVIGSLNWRPRRCRLGRPLWNIRATGS